MAIGIIGVIHRIYRLGKEMFPGRSASQFKHRALMLWRALLRFRAVRDWYRITDNPWLHVALRRFPVTHGAIYLPYIHLQWPLPRRLATIDRHYRMLTGPAAIIARSILEDVELARFDEEYPGLRLILDKAPWFSREGEAVLNLFVGEQRYYSLVFTLAIEDGQPLILIGALQGSNMDDAKTVYRDITHALHGMRPRDLIMVALKLLSGQLGIGRMWAISSASRYQVRADYDQIWEEHGGKLLDNGFFDIPVEVRYKPMEEIVSRKRKSYRQRYQMLDRVAADIAATCAGSGSGISPASSEQRHGAKIPARHGNMLAAH